MDERIFMYCRSCGWMNAEEGFGGGGCSCGGGHLAWVKGTDAELDEFRRAIAVDPKAYRRFASADYWDNFGKTRYRVCGVCGDWNIPREIDWPFWRDGQPVHRDCATRTPPEAQTAPAAP